ncbi:hypothetical protein FKM82_021005 [Ascaphus truei]
MNCNHDVCCAEKLHAGGHNRRFVSGGKEGQLIPYLFCQGLGLRLCVGDSNQVSEGQVLHAVTGGTHLFVHLVPAADAAGDKSK